MAHSKMAPKRKVNVQGQPHSLAYINKDEERMLRRMGGSGKPGPSGIPTYIGDNWGGGYSSEGGSNTDRGVSDTSRDNSNRDGSFGGSGDDRGDTRNNSVNPAERSRADVARAAEKAKADAANKTRTTARAEVQARIDRLNTYSEKKDTNFINRYAAKANVMGATRVASKLDEEGAIAIRDKSGQVVGAIHNGLFGRVYSGKMMAKSDYTGPAEFANQVTLDDSGRDDGNDQNIRGGAKPKEKVVESIDGEVNLPDAPTGGEGGDATDDAKKLSKMGKESTISTTSQGLLGSAKTRNRSLMSGLIS
jgi:hypothetical protein